MWLLKTEPSSYAYDDLERDKRATWDGVKNPVALRNLRAMNRVVVDLTPAGRLPRPVTLAEIRQLRAFADSPLLRQGRLSVVPLTKEQWNALTKKTTE